MHLNLDAFSNGQIASKLWLRDELFHRWDEMNFSAPPTVWILGGWYAMTGFILLSAAPAKFSRVCSFDKDPAATEAANRINNNWEIDAWKFRAFTADCDQLEYRNEFAGPPPDLVINTSCEHFASRAWWERIPPGTYVALQSNNMIHPDEPTAGATSLEEFQKQFPLSPLLYAGDRRFDYPQWGFNRYMLIGRTSC